MTWRVVRPGTSANGNLALAPNGLPSDSCPVRSFQVGFKFGKISLILRLPNKTAQRVNLPGAAGVPRRTLGPDVASRHFDLLCTLAHRREIDLERTRAVKCAQLADPVTDPRKKSRKFGTRGQPAVAFELGGGKKAHTERIGLPTGLPQINSHGLQKTIDAPSIPNETQNVAFRVQLLGGQQPGPGLECRRESLGQ